MSNPFPMTVEQKAEFDAYVADVYANWEDHPDCRFYVPGEGMWGKVLPPFKGMPLVGLNSMPLDPGFQWQDIFVGDGSDGFETGPGTIPTHRRWKNKVWFEYEALDDEDAEKDRRKEIFDRLTAAFGSEGRPGFFWKGTGYCLVQVEDFQEAAEKTQSALGALGTVPTEEEEA